MQAQSVCTLNFTMGLLMGLASNLKDRKLAQELIGAAESIQDVLDAENDPFAQLAQDDEQ